MSEVDIKQALVSALKGRNVNPSDLLALDTRSFLDGEIVNTQAISRWVDEHSEPVARQVDRSQGSIRPEPTSLDAGRDAYRARHPNGQDNDSSSPPAQAGTLSAGAAAYNARKGRTQ